jgi:hypothetical protein
MKDLDYLIQEAKNFMKESEVCSNESGDNNSIPLINTGTKVTQRRSSDDDSNFHVFRDSTK